MTCTEAEAGIAAGRWAAVALGGWLGGKPGGSAAAAPGGEPGIEGCTGAGPAAPAGPVRLGRHKAPRIFRDGSCRHPQLLAPNLQHSTARWPTEILPAKGKIVSEVLLVKLFRNFHRNFVSFVSETRLDEITSRYVLKLSSKQN